MNKNFLALLSMAFPIASCAQQLNNAQDQHSITEIGKNETLETTVSNETSKTQIVKFPSWS